MSGLYFFEAVNKATDEILARVSGDIETVGYVARKVTLAAEGEYGVVLHAVESIGGDVARKILSLEADGEVAALMLAKKIRAEKKALNVSDAPAAE